VTPVLPTAVPSLKFEELRIPELLTELHGMEVPIAPRARGTPDTVELPAIRRQGDSAAVEAGQCG